MKEGPITGRALEHWDMHKFHLPKWKKEGVGVGRVVRKRMEQKHAVYKYAHVFK